MYLPHKSTVSNGSNVTANTFSAVTSSLKCDSIGFVRIGTPEFIDSVKDDVAADEEKTTVLNPMKLQQMQFAHAALKYITRDSDVEVSYKLNTPFKTMGSISVEGETLAFDKPEWFARVAEFANNMEVYPLVKNRVRLTFTFHGLTKPIE